MITLSGFYCTCTFNLVKCLPEGYTGDGEKSSWIKTELGFDWAFNYKTQDVGETLKIAAPSTNSIKMVKFVVN